MSSITEFSLVILILVGSYQTLCEEINPYELAQLSSATANALVSALKQRENTQNQPSPARHISNDEAEPGWGKRSGVSTSSTTTSEPCEQGDCGGVPEHPDPEAGNFWTWNKWIGWGKRGAIDQMEKLPTSTNKWKMVQLLKKYAENHGKPHAESSNEMCHDMTTLLNYHISMLIELLEKSEEKGCPEF